MRMLRFLFILIFLIFAFAQLAAGTHYDQAVNKVEGEDWALYYGVIDFTADSTGTFYTQAFVIEELNGAVGGIQAYCIDTTGTEDVNVAFHYSNTLDVFLTSTVDVLDQVTTTMQIDSVGIDQAFYKTRYARLSFIGQSGNPKGAECHWYLFLNKKANAPRKCTAVYDTQ